MQIIIISNIITIIIIIINYYVIVINISMEDCWCLLVGEPGQRLTSAAYWRLAVGEMKESNHHSENRTNLIEVERERV